MANKTTIVANITFTKIIDGDHGVAVSNEALRIIESVLKDQLNMDDVHAEYVKTFVTEEGDE